jgi:2-polyprenyl-3-methyl-5-hydroxy-6-metoxy-1,4-benzoquinol methylase
MLKLKKILRHFLKNQGSVIRKSVKTDIWERYSNRPIAGLGYATVKDFCDSTDFFSTVMQFESSLKDVQRPWVIKAILGTVPVGSKILEIGGGEPLVSGALQNLGYDITLIDPYDGSGNGPKEYDQFQHMYMYPQVRILRGYFEKDCSLLAGELFDCIFSVSVLEHIPTENLEHLFNGIDQFLRPGGYSIHCIDDIVDGPTADWHFQELREILALQFRLQNHEMPLRDARSDAENKLSRLHEQLHNDIETYYLSPLEFYRWKNGSSYEEYPFRKIISVQSCVMKQ